MWPAVFGHGSCGFKARGLFENLVVHVSMKQTHTLVLVLRGNAGLAINVGVMLFLVQMDGSLDGPLAGGYSSAGWWFGFNLRV